MEKLEKKYKLSEIDLVKPIVSIFPRLLSSKKNIK